MKLKSLLFVLSLLSVLAFVGCGLFKTVTLEEAKTNLETQGYEVKVIEGSEFADSSDNPHATIVAAELDKYLCATKGDDVIHMYFFYSISQASSNYSCMHEDRLLGGQVNELVYFATKQARSDAGL